MRHFLKWCYHLMLQAGLNVLQLGRAMLGAPVYIRNCWVFRRQYRKAAQDFRWGRLTPCLADRFAAGGELRGHYFHQDLWAAQRIHANQPRKHVDIGSRIDGFVAHVAAFREIEIIDIRPLESKLANITCRQWDAMDPAWPLREYCDSLSCLSVLEHFGLGRYGDRVDYRGHLTGWDNLYQTLQPGGKLYFSVPIGNQRIEFDAHRVFAVPYLLQLMEGKYQVDRLAYVNDQGELVQPAARDAAAENRSFGCAFGCGLFELTKVG